MIVSIFWCRWNCSLLRLRFCKLLASVEIKWLSPAYRIGRFISILRIVILSLSTINNSQEDWHLTRMALMDHTTTSRALGQEIKSFARKDMNSSTTFRAAWTISLVTKVSVHHHALSELGASSMEVSTTNLAAGMALRRVVRRILIQFTTSWTVASSWSRIDISTCTCRPIFVWFNALAFDKCYVCWR